MKLALLVLLCLAVVSFAQDHDHDHDHDHHGHDHGDHDHHHGHDQSQDEGVAPEGHFPHVNDITTSNFEELVLGAEYALVEFYAPWCGHCKHLAPEYAEAAKILSESHPQIKLCKVDATVQPELAEKFGVEGYPTLKFFSKGNTAPDEYTGGRTSQEIVNWLKRRSGSLTEEVKSVEDLEKLISELEIVGVYVGSSESTAYKNLLQAARSYDEIVFLTSNADDVKAKLEVSDDSFVLYSDHASEKHVLTDLSSEDKVSKFIDEHKFPLVQVFTQSAAQRIFGEGIDAIFLVKSDTEAGKTAEEVFRSVAQESKGTLIFSVGNFEDDMGGRLAEFVGAEESHLPVVWIIQPSDNMRKYNLEGAITADNLRTFINDWKNNKLQALFKSEPIPSEPYDGNVRVVVGKNFNEVVLDTTKNVLLEFYAPWCGHCQHLAPIYEAVAAKVRHVDDLIIAKIDGAANEVESVAIEGFPTLKFYAKDGKQSPIDFEGERTEEGILGFLATYTDVPGINTGRETAKEVNQDEKVYDNIDL